MYGSLLSVAGTGALFYGIAWYLDTWTVSCSRMVVEVARPAVVSPHCCATLVAGKGIRRPDADFCTKTAIDNPVDPCSTGTRSLHALYGNLCLTLVIGHLTCMFSLTLSSTGASQARAILQDQAPTLQPRQVHPSLQLQPLPHPRPKPLSENREKATW